MKHFRKSVSLILALALLLSTVYIAPVVSRADSILSVTYAANLRVKTTKVTNLMSGTSAGSTVRYTLPAGTMLSVKALHAAGAGYWYEVLYYDTTLYIDASAATMVDHLTGDVTATDLMTPAALGLGNGFPLKGKIASTLNKLGTVTAAVHHSANITAAPAIVSTDTIDGNAYTIDNSPLDTNLIFSDLAAGSYTFLLTVEAISYYIDDSGALARSVQTVVLDSKPCIVTNAGSPNPVIARGIDVSYYQGSINWASVANQVDFAILRLGYATTMDSQFTTYASACNTNSVPFGIYLYSYAENTTEALQEANFVISALRNYDVALPVFYDFEDECQSSLSASAKHAIVKTFCDTVKAAGYDVGLYTFLSWFNAAFTDSYYSSMPKWVAQIDVAKCSYTKGLTCWQYSWTGSVSGISGNVDCDYWYGEFPGKNTDTSYLASCTYYPSHLKVTTTTSVNMRQYPDTGYAIMETLDEGVELEVTGVYKNPSGNYWYQVSRNGTTGYIHSAYATVNQWLYNDISVMEPTMADNLALNSGYSLQGTVHSLYNNLKTVYGKVYNEENTLAAPVLHSSDNANTKKYKLIRSKVCDNLIFSDLETGYYTYEISADVDNYYVDNGTLTARSENVVVWTAPFTVGDASIESDATACIHEAVTDPMVAATCTSTGLTEGAHCGICGAVLVAQTVIPALEHVYTASTLPATCIDYEKLQYTCANCADTYCVYPDDLPSHWSETKPEGMEESEIQAKTQYRYSDYEVITSESSQVEGYTKLSKEWIESESGTNYYVTEWPAGFDATNAIYTKYNNTKLATSTAATRKTVAGNSTLDGYIYWHWCRGTYTSGPIDRAAAQAQDSTHTTFHAFFDTTDPATLTTAADGSVKLANGSCCTDSYWFFSLPVYAQSYTKYTALYTHARWTDFSEWSDTAVTPGETRQVETRTVYRHIDAPLGDHSYVNGVCSVCGKENPTAYYLFGNINDTDYGWGNDYANMGEYLFVDGTLTTGFKIDSYVAVKTSDNLVRFMTDGWQGEVSSATLYPTDSLSDANLLYVPGGLEITFTLAENSDGSLTLSYTTAECSHARHDTSGLCTVCGHTVSHTYVNGVCSICAKAKVIPTITPKYPTVSFDGEIRINVYYDISDTESVEEMGLLIWYSARPDGNIDDAMSIVSGAALQSNGLYSVCTQGIPAKNLGDSLYFKIYARMDDGSYVYSTMISTSAKAYAQSIIANSGDSRMKALAVAMLNYGAAAQIHFGHKPYDLMNAGLTDAQKALVKDYDAGMVSGVGSVDSTKVGSFAYNATGYSRRYPSVLFEGAFAINYYFTPTMPVDGDMILYYWTAADYAAAKVLSAENATGSVVMTPGSTGAYEGSVANIAAKEIDQTVYVAGVYTFDGVTYATGVLPYSLGAYCVDQINHATGTMQALAVQTAIYGYYAKQYFSE